MKTLFYVDKTLPLRMANHLALEALQKSEYHSLERLTKIASWGAGSYIKPRHDLYWIYEFDDILTISMPSYKIGKDGNYCDGIKSTFGSLSPHPKEKEEENE